MKITSLVRWTSAFDFEASRAAKRPRFKGIVEDARALGVNRVTLYRVLTGQWPHLKGLRRRYDKLKKGTQTR